ncbi:MAG TPA: TetR/AcrR family transcriptional regulator [Steroidobacteraceae bacterium]|jgi:TetR/AcrR family transcriptional regulator of autoinduction and epiphytic fitness
MPSAPRRVPSIPVPPPGGLDADRRRQLIGMAEEVFLEKGYHAATVDEIARRAGMSKKTIYVMFDSKAALFDALLSARLAPLAEPIPDDGRPMEDVLVDFLAAVARLVLSPQHIALTRLMIAESPRSPDIEIALTRQAVCNGDWALEVWLSRQAKCGALTCEDAHEAASMLFGMSVGELMLNQLVKSRSPLHERDVTRRIRVSVRMFLGTFARAPGRPRVHRRLQNSRAGERPLIRPQSRSSGRR